MKTALSVLLALAATPALAHPGDHVGMTFAMLAEHLFETDHIVFAVLAGLIAVLAYRAGRKAEAKVQGKVQNKAQEQHHDPR